MLEAAERLTPIEREPAVQQYLLLIGPIGGLVSVRYSLRIEPLRALGLG